MGVLWRDSAALSPLSTTLKMRENHLALFALLSCLLAYASGLCTCDKSQFQYDTVRGFRYCCRNNTDNEGFNCEWNAEKLDCSPYIREPYIKDKVDRRRPCYSPVDTNCADPVAEYIYDDNTYTEYIYDDKQYNDRCTKNKGGAYLQFTCNYEQTAYLEKEGEYQVVNPCGSCGRGCEIQGRRWCFVRDDSDCEDMVFFDYADYPRAGLRP